MLIWIISSLTPQEIHERIMSGESEFVKRLIAYLENVHTGDFLTGSHNEVIENVSTIKNYKTPIETMPEPPPKCTCMLLSEVHAGTCSYEIWYKKYKLTVDDIVLKSNVHKCTYVGCLDNKYGKCRARFPRLTYSESTADLNTGTLYLKKKEAWINTFTPVISYLFRCNTDITSLKSGTAVKSVIQYVTNYITKSSLKTHTMFEIIKSVFDK
ncbi:hypothetical protein BDN72DRAFT_916140, partial [Pluteus cervinus]